ncbi:MAG: SDR family oxidoreductase [Maribacter sp.]
MKSFKDKLVLITGGASGIGKIMSRLFLERNSKVIIWDINTDNLNQTVSELSKLGEIYGMEVDVSNPAQIQSSAEKIKETYGAIDVLINNAGIIVGSYFHEHSQDDIARTMNINSLAPMYITKAFIGDMMVKNAGHICTIASSGGLLGNPKMSVYAASKWSVIGWSDSLRIEMKQLGKDIQVTTIMPYYINTGMFDGVQSKIPILKPEKTALTIINAISNKKQMVTIPGYIYRVTRFAQAVLPLFIFDWFTGNVLGIYKTMEDFTGRKN